MTLSIPLALISPSFGRVGVDVLAPARCGVFFAELEAFGDGAHGVFLLGVNPLAAAQDRAQEANQERFLILGEIGGR